MFVFGKDALAAGFQKAVTVYQDLNDRQLTESEKELAEWFFGDGATFATFYEDALSERSKGESEA